MGLKHVKNKGRKSCDTFPISRAGHVTKQPCHDHVFRPNKWLIIASCTYVFVEAVSFRH